MGWCRVLADGGVTWSRWHKCPAQAGFGAGGYQCFVFCRLLDRFVSAVGANGRCCFGGTSVPTVLPGVPLVQREQKDCLCPERSVMLRVSSLDRCLCLAVTSILVGVMCLSRPSHGASGDGKHH